MALRAHTYLIVIIFIASLLRIIALDQVPNGFYTDEASIGYNAYSILKTGKDEHGKSMPLYFKAFGEYKNPIYIYAALPFIKVFGLNEFALRLTSAMFGILTVFSTYLLARELFDQKIALWSALFIAISPWHLQFSRIAFEAISLPFFFTLGFYFLLKGLHKGKYLIYSAITLALTFYTYAPAKAFLPFFLAGFTVLNYRRLVKFRLQLILSLGLAFIVILPLLIYTVKGQAQSRFDIISILNERSLNLTRSGIVNDKLPSLPVFKDLVDYKTFLISYSFVRNYLLHLSPRFLFLQGDLNLRHNIGGMGHLYRFEGILLIAGIIFLISRREKDKIILLWWLFIFPLASSLTYDSVPHAIRSIYGLPVFQIVAGVGLVSCISYIRRMSVSKKLIKYIAIPLLILFVGFALSNLRYYFVKYYTDYPNSSYLFWNYGMKEIVRASQNLRSINVFGFHGYYEQPYIYVLFYTKHDPKKWQSTRSLARYRFGNLSIIAGQRVGLIVHAREYSQGRTVQTIFYPNGRAGYEIKDLGRGKPPLLGLAEVGKEQLGGLMGSYFNGRDFDDLLFTRKDRSINYDWGQGSPHPLVPNDNFSVRWNGLIKADRSGLYTFYTLSDNGIRLWLDNDPVIENWSPHLATEDRAEVYLGSGWHRIVLEYNEIGHGALVRLLWRTPTRSKSPVPPDHLSFSSPGD